MLRNSQDTHRLSQKGLTLVECLISLAVVAISLGAAAPGMQQMLERRELESASAQLATDLRHTRSLAVARGTPVRLSVQTPEGTSCYVIHTGSAGDCRCSGSGTAVCTAGAEAMRTVGFQASDRLRLSSTSASMLFDAERGTVTPTGTLQLQARSGASIRQVVNIMGRVRACSPGATMPGFPAC